MHPSPFDLLHVVARSHTIQLSIIHIAVNVDIMFPNGVILKEAFEEKSIGPRTEPCSTPQMALKTGTITIYMDKLTSDT